MKFLKTKNVSKFSINDRTIIAYPEGVGPGGRVVFNSTGAIMLPKGGEGQRPQLNGVRQPEDANGYIRYNTDNNTIEGYVGGNWEIVTAPSAATVSKQTLGPGDYSTTIFGPLTRSPSSPDNILVFVENVFQISTTNFNLLYNYLGSGNTYIEFTSPVPLDKYITIYFGYAN